MGRGAGDRDGQKSIARFIGVHFVDEATAPDAPAGVPASTNPAWMLLGALAAILLISAGLLSIGRRDESAE